MAGQHRDHRDARLIWVSDSKIIFAGIDGLRPTEGQSRHCAARRAGESVDAGGGMAPAERLGGIVQHYWNIERAGQLFPDCSPRSVSRQPRLRLAIRRQGER
jgi:hypothetical protein